MLIGGAVALLTMVAGGGAWLWGGRWAGAAGQRLKPLECVALGSNGQIWVGTGKGLFSLASAGSPERVDLSSGVRQVLVDPGNPGQVYALSVSGRIFQSQDQGRTWRQTRGHGLPDAPIRTFAYDPSGPTRLVAMVAGHGYYQSDLSGEMWMQVGPQDIPDAVAMAVDPLDPRVVFVGGRMGLYRSSNQGMRFERVPVTYSWSLQGAVHNLTVAGDRSGLLAATERGVYRSEDGGRSWSPLAATGLSDVVAVAYAPGRSQVILAGSKAGLLAISRDGGRRWEQAP